MQTLPHRFEKFVGEIPRNPEFPHYREDQYIRKLVNSTHRALETRPDSVLRPIISLWESELQGVIDFADLSPLQEIVILLRAEGHSFGEIGRLRRISKQAAMQAYGCAAKKVARAWLEYPQRGLAQAYDEETSRGLNAPFRRS